MKSGPKGAAGSGDKKKTKKPTSLKQRQAAEAKQKRDEAKAAKQAEKDAAKKAKSISEREKRETINRYKSTILSSFETLHGKTAYEDLGTIGQWVGIEDYPDDSSELKQALAQLKQDGKLKASGGRYTLHPDLYDAEEVDPGSGGSTTKEPTAVEPDEPEEVASKDIIAMISEMPPGMPWDADSIRNIYKDQHVSDEAVAEVLAHLDGDEEDAGIFKGKKDAARLFNSFNRTFLPGEDISVESIKDFEDLWSCVEEAHEDLGDDNGYQFVEDVNELIVAVGGRAHLPLPGSAFNDRFHERSEDDGGSDTISHVVKLGYEHGDIVQKALVTTEDA